MQKMLVLFWVQLLLLYVLIDLRTSCNLHVRSFLRLISDWII
jgi:lipoate-protein ligase B